MLKVAGIVRNDCLLTNVFDFQLPNNDVKNICVPKLEAERLIQECPVDVGDAAREILLTPPDKGSYVPAPIAIRQLMRLRAELEDASPNVIVCLGTTALWAVCAENRIKMARGAVRTSVLVPPFKALPTYHPAFILRSYNMRMPGVADLIKARKESEFPEIRTTRRELWLDPSIEDLDNFHRRFMDDPRCLISADIETKWGQIECIGFAPDRKRAIVVPFVDTRKRNQSYWPTAEQEVEAWLWCKAILEGPQPKLFQNGPFDVQWLYVNAGIATRNYRHDTKLIHHALYPELKKDLGFLGSLYENERAWKSYAKGRATKRDA